MKERFLVSTVNSAVSWNAIPLSPDGLQPSSPLLKTGSGQISPRNCPLYVLIPRASAIISLVPFLAVNTPSGIQFSFISLQASGDLCAFPNPTSPHRKSPKGHDYLFSRDTCPPTPHLRFPFLSPGTHGLFTQDTIIAGVLWEDTKMKTIAVYFLLWVWYLKV